MQAKRRNLYLILVFLLLWPFPALSESGYFRACTNAKDRVKAIRTLGILFIDLKVYEFTAGGMREPKEDWIDAARRNLSASLITELKERSIEARVLGDDSVVEEMDDVQTLYKAVKDAILTHTYGSALNWAFFPEKVNDFDYSLGPLDQLLGRLNVDGLLLVQAGDEISTGGRKALMVVGVFTGVQPRSGVTWANAGLVDQSGSILWFSANPGKSYDLRDAGQVSTLAGRLLAEFPVQKK